tara:strand:- start:41 stop:889 length:849 start_codon:yes stop_codon:yes gene_type:complete
MSQSNQNKSVIVDRLEKIEKAIMPPRFNDVSTIRKEVVSGTVTTFSIAFSSWTIHADVGNTDYVYFAFGNIPAETSGGLQGQPLGAGENLTSNFFNFNGRISVVTGSGTQILWITPTLSLQKNVSATSNAIGNADGQTAISLSTQYSRPTTLNRIDGTYERVSCFSGISQSAVNSANSATFFIPDLKHFFNAHYSCTANFTGNRSVTGSLDNFSSTIMTATASLDSSSTIDSDLINGAVATNTILGVGSASVEVSHLLAFPYVKVVLDQQTGQTSTMNISIK